MVRAPHPNAGILSNRRIVESTQEAASPAVQPATRAARRRIASEHFAGVDGARGIAIVSVLLYHAGWSSRGLFGVDVFFVISGFLITFLLIKEVGATGRIRFGRFYARRAKRLLPGLAVTLLAVLVIVWWSGSLQEMKEAAATAVASVFQVANWQQLGAGIAYEQESGALVPLGQMWSLSATEQFYLLWPLAVAGLWFACRRRLGRFVVALFVLLAVAALMAPLLSDGSNQDRLYLGTDSRAVAFVSGAAFAAGVAWLRARRVSWAVRDVSVRSGVLITAVSMLSLAAVVTASIGTATYQDPWLYRGGFALVAVAAGLFVATLCLRGNALIRIFSWRPFAAVGVVSYSMFLLHLPVFWIVQQQAKGALPPLMLFLVGGIVTWLAAVVMHYVLTEPLRVRNWRPLSAALTVVIAFGLVLAAAWLLPLERAGHPKSHAQSLEESRPSAGFRGEESATPSVPVPFELGDTIPLPAGVDGGPFRVAVIGDSVAENMHDALVQFGSPGVSVIDVTGGGCGIIDAEKAHASGGYTMDSKGLCWRWQSDLRAATVEHPVDAFVVHNLWDVNDQLIAGAWVGPCETAWQKRYASQLDLLASIGGSAEHRPSILLSNDHPREDNSTLNRERLDCANRVTREALERHPNLHLLDLEKAVCPTGACLEADADGQPIYRDGSHFNATGMALLAPWLENALARAVWDDARHPAS